MQSPQPNVGTQKTLSPRFWLLVWPTGVATGIAAGLLMKLLRIIQHAAWAYTQKDFLAAVEASSFQRRVLILIAAGAIAAAAHWLFREARGEDSGGLAEALWFHTGRLPFLRTLGRAIVSIVIVGMGASLGREAAPRQAGAALAAALAGGAGLSSVECRLLVACGAGAGIAAIYNVPFGGALFALEVLLGSLALPLVAPALITSSLATAVAWLFLPIQPTYQVPHYAGSTSLLVLALVLGPCAGIISVFYVRLFCWADLHKPKGVWAAVVPVVTFAALGALAIVLPQLLGNGKNVVQLAFTGQMGTAVLALVFLLKPLVTAACFGSGAPGGLFTPTLTFGAAFGVLAGRSWAAIWPGPTAGACAIVGAASILAATTQGPISAVVLILELTWHADALIAPIMIAVAGATVVASMLEPRSVYSGRIHIHDKAVKANPTKAPALSVSARYRELLQTLLALPDPGQKLKLIDEDGTVVGEVSAEQVRALAPRREPVQIATARDFVEETKP